MGQRMDLVVLTDLPAFKVVATGRVLKHADAAAVVSATELLTQARQRDAMMVVQARTALEQARERGLSEGRAQAHAELAGRLATAEAARQVALHELAPVLAEIVADAVAVVMRSADRQQLIASAVAAVSGLLRQARWARLRVHPTQAAAARAALAAEPADNAASASAAQMASVVPDASVSVDACIFETDVGTADASLSVQIDTLRRAIQDAASQLAVPAADDADA